MGKVRIHHRQGVLKLVAVFEDKVGYSNRVPSSRFQVPGKYIKRLCLA